MPPTSPAKTLRRRAILEAALEVFSSHGFEGARVEEIARIAGVGKGTIYEHFEHKEDLFLNLCAHLVGENLALARTRLQASPLPAPARLRQYLSDLIRSVTELLPRMGLFFEAWSLAWTRPQLRSQCQRMFRDLYDPLHAEIVGLLHESDRSGGPPTSMASERATLILAAIDGLAYQTLFRLDQGDLPRLAATAEQLLLHGLEPQS
jgi:AcrR family transcriptional regulator